MKRGNGYKEWMTDEGGGGGRDKKPGNNLRKSREHEFLLPVVVALICTRYLLLTSRGTLYWAKLSDLSFWVVNHSFNNVGLCLADLKFQCFSHSLLCNPLSLNGLAQQDILVAGCASMSIAMGRQQGGAGGGNHTVLCICLYICIFNCICICICENQSNPVC